MNLLAAVSKPAATARAMTGLSEACCFRFSRNSFTDFSFLVGWFYYRTCFPRELVVEQSPDNRNQTLAAFDRMRTISEPEIDGFKLVVLCPPTKIGFFRLPEVMLQHSNMTSSLLLSFLQPRFDLKGLFNGDNRAVGHRFLS